MIKDTVYSSRSYRSFDESHKISRDVLLSFVDTARLCPSASNLQPLKYRIVTDEEEVDELFPLTRWAGALPDMKLPPDGHHPTAYIVVCCDTTVVSSPEKCQLDAGIAIQTIMLEASEAGIGGCIIGSFDPTAVSQTLLIPKKYKPMIVLALGYPDETVIICNIDKTGSTKYFRDTANLHFVPKRSLEDVIIE